MYPAKERVGAKPERELAEAVAEETGGAATRGRRSSGSSIDKLRLIDEIKRYQSELSVPDETRSRQPAPIKALTQVHVRPVRRGNERLEDWNAYSDQGFRQAGRAGRRPGPLQKSQSSGPGSVTANQDKNHDAATNKGPFYKVRRSGQREYYELPIQNFDLNTFTLQRSIEAAHLKLQASTSVPKLVHVENKAQVPRQAAFTSVRSNNLNVRSSNKSERRAPVGDLQKSKSSPRDRVKAPAAITRTEKSLPYLSKNINRMQPGGHGSYSVLPVAEAPRAELPANKSTSAPRAGMRDGHFERFTSGKMPDMYAESRGLVQSKEKTANRKAAPPGSSSMMQRSDIFALQHQSKLLAQHSSAGGRQLPLRAKNGTRDSLGPLKLSRSIVQPQDSQNWTGARPREIHAEQQPWSSSRDAEAPSGSSAENACFPNNEQSFENDHGHWQNVQKALMIKNQKMIQQVFQDFQLKMAKGQDEEEGIYRRLLDLPGPRDELLSQDLYQIMEGGLVNNQKLKDFLESTQHQQDASAINGNVSQIETWSLSRSLLGFDGSDMKDDQLPRRTIFAACADKFTSKSCAQQPMPSAMPLPSTQELGLNTKKVLHGANAVLASKSSENMRAYSRGLGAVLKSSASQRTQAQQRQLMQRKSRNELVYHWNRQLTDYTHKCEVETKRRMVAQNLNNWNERPYVALQIRSEDPDGKADHLGQTLGEDAVDRPNGQQLLATTPREKVGLSGLPLASQLGRAGRTNIDMTSTWAEALRKSYSLYRKGRGLVNGVRNQGARKIGKPSQYDPQGQLYRTWTRLPGPPPGEKRTVEVEVLETANGNRDLWSKENSTEQISQGIQALNELDQDIQEQRTDQMRRSPDQDHKPKTGEDGRWKGGRNESPWIATLEVQGGGMSKNPSAQGIPSLALAAGKQVPMKVYQMHGNQYLYLDNQQKQRPQNYNLSVDLRDKQKNQAKDAGQVAAGDFACPESQVSSQDQKLATTLREASRAEGLPSNLGTKASGGGHHQASVLKSDLAVPQIAAVVEPNAESLARSSTGPAYAEDLMLKMYDTARNDLSSIPKGQRFSERRNSHSPMIDDIVHSALQEEKMKPITNNLEEQPRLTLKQGSTASGGKRVDDAGGQGEALPKKRANLDKREDSADADTHYNNRVLIFSRNQTITASSQRSGAEVNASQNIKKQPRGQLEKEAQPHAMDAKISNQPAQVYQQQQDGADNSESFDASTSMQIATREKKSEEPALAGERDRAARSLGERQVLQQYNTNEDLNVHDDQVLFERGASQSNGQHQRFLGGSKLVDPLNQGHAEAGIRVPVSEMKLKIKKFQYWLAGNHHKDLERRLRNEDNEAQKMEQARLKAQNRLRAARHSRPRQPGEKRARTQLGGSRATSKAEISSSGRGAGGITKNQLDGAGAAQRGEGPSRHRVDNAESRHLESPEHRNQDLGSATRFDLDKDGKSAGAQLAVTKSKSSPQTQQRQRRRPSPAFLLSLGRVRNSKSPARRPQHKQKQSNKKFHSGGKDDQVLRLDLTVSGRSAMLVVQAQAERLQQRDLLFEKSQGGVTTEQFSETQLPHKYNRSGSFATRLNSVQHRVALPQSLKREAALRKENMATFKPYQEAGDRDPRQDSIQETVDEEQQGHVRKKKQNKDEEPRLYKTISIKSQELGQESRRKEDKPGGDSITGGSRGSKRPLDRRRSSSRSSQKYIDIPHAYHGPYREKQHPNGGAHPTKYPPMEVLVTSKSSVRGSVESVEVECGKDSKVKGQGKAQEADASQEAAQRRQVLHRSKVDQRSGRTLPASKKLMPVGLQPSQPQLPDNKPHHTLNAEEAQPIPNEAANDLEAAQRDERLLLRQDLAHPRPRGPQPAKKSPETNRGSEGSESQLELEVTGTLLQKELQDAKRVTALPPPMGERNPEELPDFPGLESSASKRKWQSPFILKKRAYY